MTSPAITILDGGMGRELEKRGAPFKQPEWSAIAMMNAPDIVKDVHKAFIFSGASVIMTNSYALVPFHIGEERFKNQGKILADSAGKVARTAVNETKKSVLVAGSIPPLFGSYRADLYKKERVTEIALPLIEGLGPHVDLWILETQSLIDEPVRIKSLIDQQTEKKPLWVSFTLEDSEETREPLLRSGETVFEAVNAMVEIGVDAILFNCSQPEVIKKGIEVTSDQLASLNAQDIKIGAYANAFPPQLKNATANEGLSRLREDLTPYPYLDFAKQWIQKGATLIGGCCGIGPEHISVLSKNLI